jgi:hypothetical protein
MVLHPDVQRKAQEEIDRVVGNDRLPTFSDRELLPYVDALTKEVMRWHVVAPIGQIIQFSAPHTSASSNLAIPHCSSRDDIYKGYFIPKGSTIIVNVW